MSMTGGPGPGGAQNLTSNVGVVPDLRFLCGPAGTHQGHSCVCGTLLMTNQQFLNSSAWFQVRSSVDSSEKVPEPDAGLIFSGSN